MQNYQRECVNLVKSLNEAKENNDEIELTATDPETGEDLLKAGEEVDELLKADEPEVGDEVEEEDGGEDGEGGPTPLKAIDVTDMSKEDFQKFMDAMTNDEDFMSKNGDLFKDYNTMTEMGDKEDEVEAENELVGGEVETEGDKEVEIPTEAGDKEDEIEAENGEEAEDVDNKDDALYAVLGLLNNHTDPKAMKALDLLNTVLDKKLLSNIDVKKSEMIDDKDTKNDNLSGLTKLVKQYISDQK